MEMTSSLLRCCCCCMCLWAATWGNPLDNPSSPSIDTSGFPFILVTHSLACWLQPLVPLPALHRRGPPACHHPRVQADQQQQQQPQQLPQRDHQA